MSATISTHPEAPVTDGWPALRALARAEAKRFARHPCSCSASPSC